MKADILCTLIAQRINPEHFQLWGLEVKWMKEEYNTPENRAIVADVISNYETLKLPILANELRQEIVNAVQLHMDTTAQTRNYDNIHTLASYEFSIDPTFKAEGTAGRKWRDNVWIICRGILEEVEQGLRPMPTVAEVISELPTIEW